MRRPGVWWWAHRSWHVSTGPCARGKCEPHLTSAPATDLWLLVNDTVGASVQELGDLYVYIVRAWSNSELSDARLLQMSIWTDIHVRRGWRAALLCIANQL